MATESFPHADSVTASTRLGFVIPSSNVRVEPAACALLGDQPSVTAHFARIAVRTVSLDRPSDDQFALARLLAAAAQLKDADVDWIVWAGTSGSWRGVDTDRELVKSIGDTLNVPATTSTLSLLAACAHLKASDLALVTPYTEPIVHAIVENLQVEGLNIRREAHFGISDSHSCSQVYDEDIASAIRQLAGQDLDGVVVLCTNFGLRTGSDGLEREIGIPIIDSVNATIWHACTLAHGWRSRPTGGQLLASTSGSLRPGGDAGRGMAKQPGLE